MLSRVEPKKLSLSPLVACSKNFNMRKEIQLNDKEFVEVSMYQCGDEYCVEVIEWYKRDESRSAGKRLFLNTFPTEEEARANFEETVEDLK